MIESNQGERGKSIRDEYAEKTRAEILKCARKVFAEVGFGASSLQKIAERAGVTRGALYHHFKNKEDIFLAVVRILQAELIEHLSRTVPSDVDDSWAGVSGILSEFLKYSQKYEYRQIVLIEGPGALGWVQWRKVEEEYSLAFIGSLVDTLLEKGGLIVANREALTTMILGLAIETSLTLATSKDAAMAADVQRVAEHMLLGLKAD